jgi:hypothetical protein
MISSCASTLRFPEREEGAEEVQAPREPTLLLDKAELLAGLVQSETRSVLIRLRASDTQPNDIS